MERRRLACPVRFAHSRTATRAVPTADDELAHALCTRWSWSNHDQRQFRLPVNEGIIVSQVAAGSLAAGAGIRQADIIVALDDTEITSGGDLRRELRERWPGSTVTLTVLSPAGARRNVRVVLGETRAR